VRKRSTFGVQVLAERRDRALADALQAERLHQLIDPSGRDALHVRLLDDRHQRPLCAPAWLEETGKITPIAHSGYLQGDAADACVPPAVTGPVALASARTRALVALGVQMLCHFDFHQGLRQCAHALTQKVHVLTYLRLAQQFLKRHPSSIGHPVGPPLGLFVVLTQ
jgi:hypothetical protein